MQWEFDSGKSQANKQKHGIDFMEAQQLWADPDRIEIPARTKDEPRSMLVGKIKGVCWSAIVTTRVSRIRIISVRRSRVEEVELYEGKGTGQEI